MDLNTVTQPHSVTTVDIGICTYRRPALVATLLSLFELDVPEGVKIRLIVADNDAEPSAEASVERLRKTAPFEITYVHCPKSNISIARNACLLECKADYLAFIDDDETAPPHWLAALLDKARQTGAEAVLGPVTAVYRDSAPSWMKRGDFHSTVPVWVNGEIITGYTCNTLLKMDAPSVRGRRFALALGQSGGEDTHFFSYMHAAGGKIAFAEQAMLSEPVPESRASFMWLARRRFRSGQTHGRVLAEKKPGFRRVMQMLTAGSKVLYCATFAALNSFDAVRRNRYALRGALHMGSASGAFGVREIRQYGTVEAT
ncbi:glycosyltransferase family 2 protein [Agrobacterium tumefaciens]|uniref:glycosyltransferase n=1 Tax=Agrobacterium tumefaciens TaxID=358 RepID=UPI00287DD6D2|nr:glycosyltransferase family 2 protein [Agrobacterium tumefaciens]MDS7595070.1 glycosyltransferase [Agrobacterium tumefaciens]